MSALVLDAAGKVGPHVVRELSAELVSARTIEAFLDETRATAMVTA